MFIHALGGRFQETPLELTKGHKFAQHLIFGEEASLLTVAPGCMLAFVRSLITRCFFKHMGALQAYLGIADAKSISFFARPPLFPVARVRTSSGRPVKFDPTPVTRPAGRGGQDEILSSKKASPAAQEVRYEYENLQCAKLFGFCLQIRVFLLLILQNLGRSDFAT